MGRITTLYGFIHELPDRKNKYKNHNQEVLDNLPIKGDWPYLVQGMFYLPKEFQKTEQTSYWGRMILFGGSFKALEDEWAEWITKFESLLSQLIWAEAKASLITELFPEQTCDWQITNDYFSRLCDSSVPLPPSHKDWSFEGPRSFEDIDKTYPG